MPNIKVKATSIDGNILERGQSIDLNSSNTSFDPTGTDLSSTDQQSATVEVNNKIASSSSPGFSFGRASNVNSGTWLQCEGVPSNKSGRFVFVTNAKVTKVFVSNDQQTTFTIEVYVHDGNEINLSLLGSVVVSNKYGDSFDVDWAVPFGKQLSMKLSIGSARNVVGGVEVRGGN